eukprot:PhM_4_TR18500/c0_g1_i1/m.25435
MALFLRTERSCYPDERITKLFSNVTQRRARQVHQTQTDYEAHKERELWHRLRNDRSQDLVLIFGDQDVRVYKRAHGQRTDGNLTTVDLANVDQEMLRMGYNPSFRDSKGGDGRRTYGLGGDRVGARVGAMSIAPLNVGSVEEASEAMQARSDVSRLPIKSRKQQLASLNHQPVSKRLEVLLVPQRDAPAGGGAGVNYLGVGGGGGGSLHSAGAGTLSPNGQLTDEAFGGSSTLAGTLRQRVRDSQNRTDTSSNPGRGTSPKPGKGLAKKLTSTKQRSLSPSRNKGVSTPNVGGDSTPTSLKAEAGRRQRHHRPTCPLHPTQIQSKMMSVHNVAPFPRDVLQTSERLLSTVSRGGTYFDHVAPKEGAIDPFPVITVDDVQRGGGAGLCASSYEFNDVDASIFLTETKIETGEPGPVNECDCTPRSADDEDAEWAKEQREQQANSLGDLSAPTKHEALRRAGTQWNNVEVGTTPDGRPHASKRLRKFQSEAARARTSMACTLKNILHVREEQRKAVCRDMSRVKSVVTSAQEYGKLWSLSRSSASTPQPKHDDKDANTDVLGGTTNGRQSSRGIESDVAPTPVGPGVMLGDCVTSSLWMGVYDTMRRDKATMMANSSTYRAFIEFCRRYTVPRDAVQETFILRFRDVMMRATTTLTEEMFLSLLEGEEGKQMMTTSRGASIIVLYLRELLGTSKKDLLMFLLKKPWGGACSEVVDALHGHHHGSQRQPGGGRLSAHTSAATSPSVSLSTVPEETRSAIANVSASEALPVDGVSPRPVSRSNHV